MAEKELVSPVRAKHAARKVTSFAAIRLTRRAGPPLGSRSLSPWLTQYEKQSTCLPPRAVARACLCKRSIWLEDRNAAASLRGRSSCAASDAQF